MPRNGKHPRAAREVQHVPVVEFVVDRAGRRRQDVRVEALEQGAFPIQQHGFGLLPLAPDDRRVGPVGQHRCAGSAAEFGGGTDVVLVPVGEDDPRQLDAQFGQQPGDGRTGTGDPGVDEGRGTAVVPEVGLSEFEPQQVEVRHDLDHVHAKRNSALGRCSSFSLRVNVFAA
ncbi:hypothetical protein A8926_0101 [Saccharopolyspora spinosa]|uniref:Uncharacterized protein n=1 Tax=Saccharopolyspora spinosa TaxID=60894 RepID=A0A2N3XPU5_SACSN|nr:hypothetical protein [Saccharopolyspora spinosa]PKW12632.1 hypothetical protein A8926_0101 [Saccharopolyspora spinosa]